MDHAPPLDPDDVLGVGPEATAEALREALRVKALKHHPDHGGDAWAFRVVHWAYQTRLKRLAGTAARPATEAPSSPRPAPTVPRPPIARGVPARSRWETPQPGIQDRVLDPAQLVEVEMVRVLREADLPMGGLGLLGEDRSLGARLAFQWPDRDVTDDPRTIPHADLALRALSAVFEEARERPGVTSAQSRQEAGRFSAWLSYESAVHARKALRSLHLGLRARGLGMNQWSRVETLP